MDRDIWARKLHQLHQRHQRTIKKKKKMKEKEESFIMGAKHVLEINHLRFDK